MIYATWAKLSGCSCAYIYYAYCKFSLIGSVSAPLSELVEELWARRGITLKTPVLTLAALKMLMSRGTPLIFDARPAKWNVLSVIYVVGSPRACPDITPIGMLGTIDGVHIL